MQRAHRNVVVLIAAQGILGAQLPILMITAGLAGQSLSPIACLATLPISMLILGSAISARPMSRLMQLRGRRFGFIFATFVSALGAAVMVAGLILASFWIFAFGTLLCGAYMSAHGFIRFAAADTASPEFQPRAISWVMAAGLCAAIIGPAIVRATDDLLPLPFMASYLAVIGLNLVGPLIFLFLDIPIPPAPKDDDPKGRNWGELLQDPRIPVAMICAMVSYALMNLTMTATPLAVVGCGFAADNAASVVSAHVLAMYAPSFFTGNLIGRFGAPRIIGTGMLILLGAGLVALSGVTLTHFFGALILLGLGWNFGFIGATTLLAQSHRPEERGRVQGVNDLIVFAGVFFASLASGGLMNCAGGTAQAGWNAVNIAMIPFLMLAGLALIWLIRRQKQLGIGA